LNGPSRTSANKVYDNMGAYCCKRPEELNIIIIIICMCVYMYGTSEAYNVTDCITSGSYYKPCSVLREKIGRKYIVKSPRLFTVQFLSVTYYSFSERIPDQTAYPQTTILFLTLYIILRSYVCDFCWDRIAGKWMSQRRESTKRAPLNAKIHWSLTRIFEYLRKYSKNTECSELSY